MNADFTEAVTPTSTAVELSVKRLRRGDVREDGMVFWCYDSNCASGEYWVAPEKFAAKKSAEKAKKVKRRADLSEKKATLPVKLRRGETREDGKVFWQYSPSCPNGEYWMTPEKFTAKKAKEEEKRAALSAKKTSLPTKLRRGDVREDGMVFWCYEAGCTDGEYWMTPEQFAAEKAEYAKKKADLSAKKAALTTKLRCGDTREDGKIFWQYDPGYTNGEHWRTPEEFAAKKRRRNIRHRERRATDPLYALKRRLRSLVHVSLKRRGFRKNSKTAAMLGCTYEEFKAHIEKQFLPGMTWANFSDCHIDHIVPLDAAKTEEDVYALNHFTNLRPMWGPDNQSKSSKLPEEHELPADLHTKVKEIYLTAKARSA